LHPVRAGEAGPAGRDRQRRAYRLMPHAAGLWYEWHGPEEGEVLILSAGLGGAGLYWAPNVGAFAQRYRVLLYDHRGTGRSSPLPPGPTSIKAMAQDVAALISHLDLRRPHFVGHALGGLIGLELALSQHGLGKLVVVNGWARLDPYTARCFDLRLELLRSSGPKAYLRAQPIFLYPAGWISAQLEALDAHAADQLAGFPPPETVESRIAAARAFDLWLDLAGDVLVVAAEDDMLVPTHCSQILAGELCEAKLETMKWGGHACNVTDPKTFNRIVLEFLGS
jgi:aminoacrylate hydrolase